MRKMVRLVGVGVVAMMLCLALTAACAVADDISLQIKVVNQSGRQLSLEQDKTLVNGGLGWDANSKPPQIIEPNQTAVMTARTSIPAISAVVSYIDINELRIPPGYTRHDFTVTASLSYETHLWVPENGQGTLTATADDQGSYLKVDLEHRLTNNGGEVTATISRAKRTSVKRD